MKIIYTADIDDDIIELSGLLDTLDEVVEACTDCKVNRSKIESSVEVCENGNWEDEAEETGEWSEEDE